MMTEINKLPPWMILLMGMLLSNQMIDASELAIAPSFDSLATPNSSNQF